MRTPARPHARRRHYKHHCCIHPEATPTPWLRAIAEGERDNLGAVPMQITIARQARRHLSTGNISLKTTEGSDFDWSAHPLGLAQDEDAVISTAAAYTNHGVTPNEALIST